MKINLNDYVKVKLSDAGVIIFKSYYLSKGLGLKKPEIDEKGFTKFQIWEFMNMFGQYMWNGNPHSPFESMEAEIEHVL